MERTEDTSMWLSWLAFLAGLWLIISPFVLRFSTITNPTSNAVIVGVIVAVAAFITAVWARVTGVWLSWLIAIAGLWLVLSPFILSYTSHMAALVNAIVLGILVIVFAGGRALTVGSPMMERRFGPTYPSEERQRKEKEEEEEKHTN